MPLLKIETIFCAKPSDWNGVDECRLEVFVDKTLQTPLSKNLHVNQTWEINQEYSFNENAKILLWDEDWPDPDDILGEITVDKKQAGSVERSINKGRGRYKLKYQVTSAQQTTSDPVQSAIHDFENSDKSGIWKYIPKSNLIADIKRAIGDPYSVRQANTPLCGPATIVFKLASKFPSKYVEICQELFEKGKFHARTKEIMPSNQLVNSAVRSGLSMSDWLLMATLRDTENEIFPVTAGSNVFVMGFTTPWEMKGWTFELLGYTNSEYLPLYFSGDFTALRKAKHLIKSGGVAFLMIHSALLEDQDPTPSYPNHWVSVEAIGRISSTRKVELTCYSWGREFQIDVPIDQFEKHTWGMVYGTH